MKRILLVEDDSALNEAYSTILSTTDYIVTATLNGQAALDKIRESKEPYDLILLDLRMPVLDGVGFLREYDATKHPETKVVVFSNYDAQNEVDEAFELGAHKYILKARTAPKELLKTVAAIIG